MNAEINAFNLNPNCVDTNPLNFEIQLPNKCPHCSTAYSSKPEHTCFFKDATGSVSLYSTFFCPTCEKAFFITYNIDKYYSHDYGYIVNQYPASTFQTPFSKEVSLLSPKFVEVYHQAELAESSNLTEICGMGYRKSLEFLVKDYAIHEHPEDKEIIEKTLLSQCIKKYIDNDTITTLAERSAWLGNDEAHYIRRQENRDVSDLKSFIQATAYFISMIFIAKDAASMTSK